MNIVYQTQNVNSGALGTATIALAANAARIGWSIQNQGTNPLLVLLGSSPSSSVFHFSLQPCTAVNDGKGGIISQLSGVVYTDIITVTGTAPSYSVLELAP